MNCLTNRLKRRPISSPHFPEKLDYLRQGLISTPHWWRVFTKLSNLCTANLDLKSNILIAKRNKDSNERFLREIYIVKVYLNIRFIEPNLKIIKICKSEIFNNRDYTSFSVHNNRLNLCLQVENSQSLLCSRKQQIWALKIFY